MVFLVQVGPGFYRIHQMGESTSSIGPTTITTTTDDSQTTGV